MKAIVYDRYGPPDVLELREVERPVPTEEQVLVRVQAASVNPLDWHTMRGEPYFVRLQAGLRRPKSGATGVDSAGYVEAVGANVTELQVGEEVFGSRSGACAEYVAGKTFVRKPVGATFEQAAAVPVAGCTALQAVRDKGRLVAGQTVLVNGAAGGVGTFAVQIAKALGAEVTGVCSARNVELVRSIGADHVVDYSQEDFTRTGKRYDLIVDNIGNHSLSACRRVLSPRGAYVIVGGKPGRFLSGLDRVLGALVLSHVGSKRMVPMLATIRKEDLTFLAELMEAGKLTPVIDRTYPLSETPAAIAYLEEGHARGKVVVTM